MFVLEFTMKDALIFSLVAVAMIFLILLLLTGIIYLLKYLRKPEKEASTAAPAPVPAEANQSERNKKIAILTASCYFKETHDGDVKVVSCRKIN